MTNLSSVVTVSDFLAQAAPAAAPAGPSGSTMLIVYGALFAAMYFLLFAPQRKKQKEHEKMLKSLQSGDEVITAGGIYGVITNVKEDRFVVRIADDTKIELGKGFVQTVLKKQDAEKADKK